MTQSLVTVVVPIDRGHEQVNVALDGLRRGWGAAAPERLAQLRDFIHFMSVVVVPKDRDARAFLLVELCADGHQDAVLERLATTMSDDLVTVIRETGNKDAPRTVKELASEELASKELASYLKAHSIRVGTKWFSGADGLLFCGTPGMTVRRIEHEALLATRIRGILDRDTEVRSALERVEHVRSEIFADANYKWAFVSEPVPLLAEAQRVVDITRSLAVAAFRDFVKPLFFLALFAGLLLWLWLRTPLDQAIWHLTLILGIVLVAVGVTLKVGYDSLRRQEEDDVPFDEAPDSTSLAEIVQHEDKPGVVQNHLFGVSTLKPGWFRPVSLLVGLWVVAEYSRGRFRPGFLETIGTIHFARWVRLPETDRLVFLSNYDGSWQSYLEDFIARAHAGLTGIWSNTQDFPKTSRLFGGGATDGPRFKRWARRQQLPTRFWYSAYPQLTTTQIRTNAAIRHGFAAVSNEIAAANWLALFGYSGPEQVEKEQISALVFGGLPALPYAHCLLVGFGDRREAQNWLRDIRSELAYGEHAQMAEHCLVAAFTADGLLKLKLDAATLATFPNAFEQGMSAPVRAHALGDNNNEQWWWGGTEPSPTVDAALILYSKEETLLSTQIQARRWQLNSLGHRVLRDVRLQKLEKTNVEPFGFVDGVSQPIMRGSKNWSKPEYAMHVVEPGELLLGYRDNLGNIAPSPSCNGKDIGRNGTFLVMRQLEQHTREFDKYVEREADRLEREGRVPGFTGDDLKHWVAARMVGRWRDGSSLVRNAHPPSTKTTPEPSPKVAAPSPKVAAAVTAADVALSKTAAEALSETMEVLAVAVAVPSKTVAAASLPTTSTAVPPPPSPTDAPSPDNEFQYGTEDPYGLRCPLGAHIRRANPRDSFDPGSPLQLAISNRHRILRVGRAFIPEDKSDPGLLFMCINADIERQFEFLQQTWLLGSNFHGLDDEIDPMVGYRGPEDSMTVPTPNGPVRMSGLEKFVTVRGGGYFFIPGKSVLYELAP